MQGHLVEDTYFGPAMAGDPDRQSKLVLCAVLVLVIWETQIWRRGFPIGWNYI